MEKSTAAFNATLECTLEHLPQAPLRGTGTHISWP